MKIEFVLGHALYMKAIHGGKAKNDKIDSFKIATLLRGGNLPKAYVYPPEMRATRDLLRRRLHLVRRRANLLAHIQNTHHQYNLAPPTAKIAYKANREGVAEAFEEADARKSVEIDFALIGHYDDLLRDIQLHLEKRAKQHDPLAYHRLRSVPGIGKVLALTILYEIQDIHRFPRVSAEGRSSFELCPWLEPEDNWTAIQHILNGRVRVRKCFQDVESRTTPEEFGSTRLPRSR